MLMSIQSFMDVVLSAMVRYTLLSQYKIFHCNYFKSCLSDWPLLGMSDGWILISVYILLNTKILISISTRYIYKSKLLFCLPMQQNVHITICAVSMQVENAASFHIFASPIVTCLLSN